MVGYLIQWLRYWLDAVMTFWGTWTGALAQLLFPLPANEIPQRQKVMGRLPRSLLAMCETQRFGFGLAQSLDWWKRGLHGFSYFIWVLYFSASVIQHCMNIAGIIAGIVTMDMIPVTQELLMGLRKGAHKEWSTNSNIWLESFHNLRVQRHHLVETLGQPEPHHHYQTLRIIKMKIMVLTFQRLNCKSWGNRFIDKIFHKEAYIALIIIPFPTLPSPDLLSVDSHCHYFLFLRNTSKSEHYSFSYNT